MKKNSLFVLIASLIMITLNYSYCFSNSFSYDRMTTIWRFAGMHEIGQLEPSEFCYISIQGNKLLMRCKSDVDGDKVALYIIDRGDSNSFVATKKIAYIRDETNNDFITTNDQDYLDTHKEIYGKISNNELVLMELTTYNGKRNLEEWIKLQKVNSFLQYAFPKQILKKHFNWSGD